jgi:hypothetical protein
MSRFGGKHPMAAREPMRSPAIQWVHDDERLGETSEPVIDLPVNVQENS